MKKTVRLILCVLVLVCLLAMPVSAAIFKVTYYEEEIYAGGIMDLYAFVDAGGVAPFTYQWQAEGFGWLDLEDNDLYKGTKTNHLQLYTKTGDYGDMNTIPFQCVVTDAEGDVFYTPSIYLEIYPTDHLIPNMRNWGYGLYEPTVTNVKNLYTQDYKNYTASAYAGAKIELSIGSKPVEAKEVLRNSEVELTREIYITENNHTTKTTDHTVYVPYTVGTVKVEFKQNLTIGSTDLGEFDSKTLIITTAKPETMARGVATKECSMLRYPYNESEKLGTLPQGAVLDVIGKEGGYYQVYVRGRGVVCYIPESLVCVDEAVGDAVIGEVDVTITEPVAGQRPDFACKVLTTGCQLFDNEPVTWYDTTDKRFLTSSDTFKEGHSYDLAIWVAAKSGYRFRLDSSGDPYLTGAINGDLPPYIHTAYEQDPEKVIELSYTFPNVKAVEPEQSHTCTPVRVERQEPTCTGKGHEAYYRCGCGMHYADAAGKQAVDISTWGVIPATGHTVSAWRVTQPYHYHVCTVCGEMLQQEDHKGGQATCTEKGLCSVCGYAYLETNENHTPDTGKWIPRAEHYHFHACKECGAHCDIEDHRWSPRYHPVDEGGHAYQCADCKGYDLLQPHIPGPEATDTTPQTCTECGYIIRPAKNHTHDLTKVPQVQATCMDGGNIEYYYCTGCNDCFTDAEAKNKIPETMSVLVDPLGHTVSEGWSTDDRYHWRTCTVCSAVLEETRMAHGPADGTCATCGYAPPAQGEETTPGKTTEPTDPAADPTTAPSGEVPHGQTPEKQGGISWAMAAMIGLVCFGASVTAAVILLKKKKK